MRDGVWRTSIAVVLAGAAIRLLAARGDLWLDEIWTLRLAREAGSVARILGSIHHDNNHYLVTLWVFLLGDSSAELAYRALSIVAGVATVLLVALLPGGGTRRDALTAAILVAVCPILVQYDSEARGYAPAAFFAVAAFHALRAHLARGGWRFAALFAGCATLGLLSHLTFLFALAGFAAWAPAELGRRRAASAAPLLAAFGPPAAALLLLWVFDLRAFVIGGGPAYRIPDVLRELARAIFATPAGPLELLALPGIVLAGIALVGMARRRDARALFFSIAIVAAPAALLAARRPEFLAPRYFVVLVPFLLLLVARGLGTIAARGPGGRALHALAVAAYCVAALVSDARLIAVGRGDYAEAVAFMRAATPEPVVTVGTDHDFRNGMLLDHAARRDPDGRPFEVIPEAAWGERPPRWFLIHDFAERVSPPTRIEIRTGRVYELAATYPHAGLSGWSWYLYRRAGVPHPKP